MKPGRELDALVAEKVMGLDLNKICDGEWECEPWPGYCDKCGYQAQKIGDRFDLPEHAIHVPHYSTSIARAWEVMEKLKTMIKEGQLHWSELGLIWSSWRWYVIKESGEHESEVAQSKISAPHAICLAALKAVEIKE